MSCSCLDLSQDKLRKVKCYDDPDIIFFLTIGHRFRNFQNFQFIQKKYFFLGFDRFDHVICLVKKKEIFGGGHLLI